MTKLYASSTDEASCDASYPDVCIASPQLNLNCNDIADRRRIIIQDFKPVFTYP